MILGHFPGDSEVILVMKTREGTRELRFGRELPGAPLRGLDAELDDLFGAAARAA